MYLTFALSQITHRFVGSEEVNMKQINEYKRKKHEFRDNCVIEKLINLLFMTHYSQNRNHRKNQVPGKGFFVLLIFIYSSHAVVDAYAANNADYNFPSKELSSQVNIRQ